MPDAPPPNPPVPPRFVRDGGDGHQVLVAPALEPQPLAGLPESRWPARFGVISASAGLFVALTVLGFAALFYTSAGGNVDDPAFVAIGAVIQGLVFLATAWVVARTAGPVRLRDFGLVRAELGPTVAKTIAIGAGYLALATAFAIAVDLKPDDAPGKLGAESGIAGMAMFVVVAALVAPVVEEMFFRGMLFRSLANGVGITLAAIFSGIFFGMLHWDFETTDRLLQVVPLTLLGVMFALLYVWTGTLYAPMALHATNNALAVGAFAVGEGSAFGLVLAVVIWLAILALCLVGPRFTDPRGDMLGP